MNFYLINLKNELQFHISDLETMLRMIEVSADCNLRAAHNPLQVLYPVCRILEYNQKDLNDYMGRAAIAQSCETIFKHLQNEGTIKSASLDIPHELNIGFSQSFNHLTVEVLWATQDHAYQFLISTKFRELRHLGISEDLLKMPAQVNLNISA